MLSLSHVSLTRGENLILDDVTLEVAPGECICIVGPAGTGKTSILELLLGLQKPSQGAVSVDEIDLSSLPPKFLRVYRRSIGYVPQDDLLLPGETVAANVALPLRMRRTPKGEITKRVTTVLTQLQLLAQAPSYPATLTQGERKKAALARALIGEPAILLADDPMTNLDQCSTREIVACCKDAHRRGTTVIITTRNELPGKSLGKRMLSLEHGKLAEIFPSLIPAPVEKLAPQRAHIPLTSV